MNVRYGVSVIVRAVMVSFLLIQSAHAYFDPGTASLLIQALIAGIGAVVVFFGNLKMRFLAIFGRKKESVGHDDSAESSAAESSDNHHP